MLDRRHLSPAKRMISVSLLAFFVLSPVVLAGPTPEELREARAALDPDPRLDGYGTSWVEFYAETFDRLEALDFTALRRTIEDLTTRFPERYPRGAEYLRRLDAYEGRRPQLLWEIAQKRDEAVDELDAILAFQREAMLANPLLDFDRLLVVLRRPIGDPRRSEAPSKGLGEFLGLPRQSSWQIHAIPKVLGWDNEIAVLSSLRGEPALKTLYRPDKRRLVGDIDLHWDADKLMFSMPDDRRLWQVWEIGTDGSGLRQLSLGDHPDVHNYDSVYLPSGKFNFISTAAFQGVPCNTGLTVGMTYQADSDGKNIRQIAFDQDHNYNPVVMNDGRVMYLRWEYTDIPHVWARFLFTMNPDGTDQRAYYGSGSYWPNSIFYARPIPDHPTKVIGVITGHHVGRVGELILFDPEKARSGPEGVVQRIPGYGKKVEPIIEDRLTINTYPKFLHPYPLSENYFLVSAKPTPDSLWGIYLVDVFDNMTLIKEVEGQALLEPIPLRKTPTPPVIPERIDLSRDDATVYLTDIYDGPGLDGVPRGAVKSLRLFTYHFAYQKIAGINHRVGADGPWEPKQVLGLAPVEKDGSALFRIPARTPISIQPLDEDGRALQLMRSWTTAQPGEFVSCNGCHESQNGAGVNRGTLALQRAPSVIAPWRGPTRGFSFRREVQPVLDQHCVSCHNGRAAESGERIPDLRAEQGFVLAYRNGVPEPEFISTPVGEEVFQEYGGVFDPAYIELRSRVRVGGLESDLRLLNPAEFHANTTELVQMLEKGHHGVSLDGASWDRISTWIDLNAPAHGTWRETAGLDRTYPDHKRRRELRQSYARFQKDDAEAIEWGPPSDIQAPAARVIEAIVDSVAGAFERLEETVWPFDADEAARRQQAVGPATRTLDLGDGVELEMVLIPHGAFIMGDPDGHPDEQPPTPVRIDRPFWISRTEITNEQYARFDPQHDSRYEHKGSWMFNEVDLGWPENGPRQPVIRISQQEAGAFCGWLSERSGAKVVLPTEAQWEYACRAGADSPLSYGDLDSDFSEYANSADWTIRDLVYDVRDQYPPDLVPRDARYSDGQLVTAQVGSYRPNAWGLHDMHGNVWEWTRTAYRPYPYTEADGRSEPAPGEGIVVRGGSWYDRPARSRSAYRLNYPSWQRVYNVGLRVVIETDGSERIAANDD